MPRILLTQGKFAEIDEIDAVAVCYHKWFYHKGGYAISRIKTKKVKLHDFIAERMGLVISKGQTIDHKDTDELNNKRENLRVATRSQQSANSKIRKDSTTGYKGVTEDKRTGRYEAYIYYNYERYHLGMFGTSQEAHNAYCKVGKQYFGEFFNAG